jgi:hypothetical protein
VFDLRQIPLEKSLLFTKVFQDSSLLKNHIHNYLSDDATSITVIQFPEHKPDLEVVAESLKMIDWIPAFMKSERYRQDNPLRVIALHERDWFLELLGATAAVIGIYDFIKKRLDGKLPTRSKRTKQRIKKTKTSYRTVTRTVTRTVGDQQFVQNIPQQVPYHEEYYEDKYSTHEVEVDSVGKIKIAQIDVIIHRIKRIEIYESDGTVKAAYMSDE